MFVKNLVQICNTAQTRFLSVLSISSAVAAGPNPVSDLPSIWRGTVLLHCVYTDIHNCFMNCDSLCSWKSSIVWSGMTWNMVSNNTYYTEFCLNQIRRKAWMKITLFHSIKLQLWVTYVGISLSYLWMNIALHVLRQVGDQLLITSEQTHHSQPRELWPLVVRVAERVDHVNYNGRTRCCIGVYIWCLILWLFWRTLIWNWTKHYTSKYKCRHFTRFIFYNCT